MDEYSHLEHLRLSLFLEDDDLMAMISVYFDDSGTHPDSDVAVAACYAGNVVQWKQLEKDWQDARDAEGFSTFGMADILGGKGEFRGWSGEKRNRLILRLITMTRIRATIGFLFAVIKSDYDEIISEPLRGKVGKFHYSFVVRACLNGLSNWRQQYRRTKDMLKDKFLLVAIALPIAVLLALMYLRMGSYR